MRAAVDVGGTFTDVLAVDDDGRMRAAKLPARPADPAAGLEEAVAAVAGESVPAELLYSTTLALNALLEHRLPRVGLVVSRGFRELLETARLPAGDPDGRAPAPARLVPLEYVEEIGARLAADGTERVPVDPDEVAAAARRLAALDVEVIAVSLLHSYVDGAQEHAVAAAIARAAPHVDIVCSADVLPELREYERTLATCLNATLIPPMRAHVGHRERDGGTPPLFVMKSSGGLASARATLRRPLTTALSGPSAAVLGMAWLGRRIGRGNLITFDVGGTSTDVALVSGGRHAMTTEGAIAGYPFRVPMVDVVTIGAGGGSIAMQGADTRWRVGPESAGAKPGPACYGRGGAQPTLTDAQLVLGRLPDALLGGTLPLDADAARAALASLGATRGLDVTCTARGILEIATHNLCGAVRRVSVLRGHDPGDYALVAIGGAGPLHGAELADLLGIRTVIVPPQPGLAAAFGLMVADLQESFVHAFGQRDDALDTEAAAGAVAALAVKAEAWLEEEGVAPERRSLVPAADMRYAGMLWETSVPLPAGGVTAATLAAAVEDFHARFERLTGHSHRGQEAVELVNLRVTAVGERDKPELLERPEVIAATGTAPRPRSSRAVTFLGETVPCESAIFERDRLAPGAVVDGPAVIEQYESTLLVPPGWRVRTDDWRNAVFVRADAPADSRRNS